MVRVEDQVHQGKHIKIVPIHAGTQMRDAERVEHDEEAGNPRTEKNQNDAERLS